ncbi:MAG: aldo/keto reductase, partial [Myxococcaceae bacterium]
MSIADYPEKLVASRPPEALLNEGKDGVVKQVQGTLKEESDITLDGYPGKAYTASSPLYGEVKGRNFLGLVSEQSHYNLRVRKPELEVIPACLDYGLGLIPWSPLAGGALAGKPQDPNGRRSEEQYNSDAERLDKWVALCGELGEEPADVAIAWLLHQPAVTAPI